MMLRCQRLYCGYQVSGALATDNSIYFMPLNACRIMRSNPDNDSLSSVGDDLGDEKFKYLGTVAGNDDCVNGIPFCASRIVKFDPANPDTTSTVGEEAEEWFECGNGVLCGDGYIYLYSVNRVGQVLQIDTTSNDYTWIGDPIYYSGKGVGWGDPTIGVVYSNLTPRHNNCHRLWGMTSVQEISNGRMVEL